MLFNSIHFLIYFPIVVLIYFLLNHNLKRYWLLIASCYFYMAFIPQYILILFLLIAIDYFAAFAIDRNNGFKRKLFLILSLVANISVLAVFKYYNFFISNLNLALATQFNILKIILPIGLSFHTFQSMSYTIEIYFRRFKPEKNLINYALYVLFFPQLVAGPIERPQHLLHQFQAPKSFNRLRALEGLELMLIGFFKKVALADSLSFMVNSVFANASAFSGAANLLAIYFFSFQIYFDFSGYTDIARGAAKILGFELMINFNLPYVAKSISEFWSRWHISLSSWFRDYLYIPLGGSRTSKLRHALNVLIVFMISGFWHGANYTFIVWGFLHGCYLIIENQLKNRIRLPWWFKQMIVFHLCVLAWVFFRLPTLEQSFRVLHKIFSLKNWWQWANIDLMNVLVSISLLLLSGGFGFLSYKKYFQRRYIKYATYYFMLVILFLVVVQKNSLDNPQQFIYFLF